MSLNRTAHRLCESCGVAPVEVDQPIENVKHSPLSQEEQVRLFEKTFADPNKLEDTRELCGPCVEAVLGVVN